MRKDRVDASDVMDRIKVALDKEEIHDALLRYCRGIDRSDKDLVLSVFHADASVDYGNIQGPPSSLLFPPVTVPSMHFLGNALITVDGDIAFAESYFLSYQVIERDGNACTRTRAGRYIDRFERRNANWKVAHRVLIDDWSRVDEIAAVIDGIGQHTGQRSREDPSYRLMGK